jgi:hypothetical protein
LTRRIPEKFSIDHGAKNYDSSYKAKNLEKLFVIAAEVFNPVFGLGEEALDH